MKKYLAECVGTFGLTLAVIISLGGGILLPTPLIAALALCLFVYSIGSISGAHLNPAVTIGLFSVRKITLQNAVAYVVFQSLGAVAAIYVGRMMVVSPMLPILNTSAVFFAECVGTFFLTFGIASVVYGKTPAVASGIVVGGSLLLGISVASVVSNGVLNPAVAFAIGSFPPVYVLGPVIGSILGIWLFAFLAGETKMLTPKK